MAAVHSDYDQQTAPLQRIIGRLTAQVGPRLSQSR